MKSIIILRSKIQPFYRLYKLNKLNKLCELNKLSKLNKPHKLVTKQWID